MGERTVCLIWCEACCNRHWDLMNRLGEAGRVVSKSGTLKVSTHCESCRAELVAGEEATAFTLDGGADCRAWEDQYLDLDPEDGVLAGDAKEGVWAKG